MKFLIIPLMLLLAGCSTIQKPIPKDVESYVAVFRNQILTTDKMRERLNGIDFIMDEDRNKEYVGIYYPITLSGRAQIVISKHYFNASSEESKLSTILHELSHGVCHLPHTEASTSTGVGDNIEKILFKVGFIKKIEKLKDKCPPSIMYPIEFSDKCFIIHKDLYFNDLRNRCK